MRTSYVPVGLAAVLLLACATGLVQINRTLGADLRTQAEQQQTTTVKIPALRGDIVDARGRVLARSVLKPSIFVDPAQFRSDREVRFGVASVAPILGLDPAELEREILARRAPDCTAGRKFMWVARQISADQLAVFEEIRSVRRLGAFNVQRESVREYPFGRLACHVLGFINKEGEGRAGIEQAYDEFLRGHDGERVSTVDLSGRRLRLDEQDYRPPVDGATVVLAIDVQLQQRVERHLQAAFEKHHPTWSSAVVLDPHTGEVLAMALAPTFDPAQPIPPASEGPALQHAKEVLRNRAVADAFEPGSIFKPFIGAMALEAGLVRLDEVFQIDGPARRFGRRIVHDTHAYDALEFRHVISHSSNIGMALLGERLGNECLYKYVVRWGFGIPTQIELPGEHDGLVQQFHRWNGYSTQSIPMGQEIAATPIQLIRAFAAFSSDGVAFQPRSVRGVIGADGALLEDDSQPRNAVRILSEDAAREFREDALAAVMSPEGTGRNLNLDGYRIFGKTGTAQLARPASEGGGYAPNAYVGSFVCGGPVDDPRVAVLVTTYHPTGEAYYGGTVAGPAAVSILEDALAYLGVPPEDDNPLKDEAVPEINAVTGR